MYPLKNVEAIAVVKPKDRFDPIQVLEQESQKGDRQKASVKREQREGQGGKGGREGRAEGEK